jgi:hypothetical protein
MFYVKSKLSYKFIVVSKLESKIYELSINNSEFFFDAYYKFYSLNYSNSYYNIKY